MGLEIVNGYVCKDCTDVARAKKGEDPATKPNSPEAREHTASGALNDDEARGINRPRSAGGRGTQVNLLL